MSIHQAKFVCASEFACASPVFVKRIEVIDTDQSEIEICGLGFFELYVNGKKVSDDVLVPPASDYGKRDLSSLYYPIHDTFSYRVYYCRYSLSEYLKKGENVLEVQLGGGYFYQNVCNGEGKRSYGCPTLAFSLKHPLKTVKHQPHIQNIYILLQTTLTSPLKALFHPVH